MNYKHIMQMKMELKDIKSAYVSIPKDEYIYLVKVVNEEVPYIQNNSEIELSTNSLKILIDRALEKLG